MERDMVLDLYCVMNLYSLIGGTFIIDITHHCITIIKSVVSIAIVSFSAAFSGLLRVREARYYPSDLLFADNFDWLFYTFSLRNAIPIIYSSHSLFIFKNSYS